MSSEAVVHNLKLLMHPNDVSFSLSLFNIELSNLLQLSLVQALDGLHLLANDLNMILG